MHSVSAYYDCVFPSSDSVCSLPHPIWFPTMMHYVEELIAFARQNCDFEETFLIKVFNVTRISSLIVLFAGMMARYDIYILLINIGALFSSQFLNWVLKVSLRIAAPNGRCGAAVYLCNDPLQPLTQCLSTVFHTSVDPASVCVPCNTPSLEIQNISFLSASVVIFQFLWNTSYLGWFTTTFVVLWNILTLYVHANIGYNTPLQILLSTAVGTLFSVAWNWLVVSLIYPVIHRMFSTKEPNRFAYYYVDTLTRHRQTSVAPQTANMHRFARTMAILFGTQSIITSLTFAGLTRHVDFAAITLGTYPFVLSSFFFLGQPHELP